MCHEGLCDIVSHPKVFHPFYQVVRLATRKGKGSIDSLVLKIKMYSCRSRSGYWTTGTPLRRPCTLTTSPRGSSGRSWGWTAGTKRCVGHQPVCLRDTFQASPRSRCSPNVKYLALLSGTWRITVGLMGFKVSECWSSESQTGCIEPSLVNGTSGKQHGGCCCYFHYFR